MTFRTPYLIESGLDNPAFSYDLPPDVVSGANGVPRYRDTGVPVPVPRRTQMPQYMTADRPYPGTIDPRDRQWLSAPQTPPVAGDPWGFEPAQRADAMHVARGNRVSDPWGMEAARHADATAGDRIVGAWDTETARQREAQWAAESRLADPWRIEAARQADVARRRVADAWRAEGARRPTFVSVDHNPFESVDPTDRRWLSVPRDRPEKPQGWPLLPEEQPLGAWDVTKDLVRSAGAGAQSSLASLPGLPGDAILAGRGAWDYGQSWLQGRPLEEVRAEHEKIIPTAWAKRNSSEAWDEYLPLHYTPKTAAGNYVRRATKFGTDAVMGGVGRAAGKAILAGGRGLAKQGGRKALQQAGRAGQGALAEVPRKAFWLGGVPGVASEAAGQLTAGTPWEAYARAVAAGATGHFAGASPTEVASLAKEGWDGAADDEEDRGPRPMSITVQPRPWPARAVGFRP